MTARLRRWARFWLFQVVVFVGLLVYTWPDPVVCFLAGWICALAFTAFLEEVARRKP